MASRRLCSLHTYVLTDLQMVLQAQARQSITSLEVMSYGCDAEPVATAALQNSNFNHSMLNVVVCAGEAGHRVASGARPVATASQQCRRHAAAAAAAAAAVGHAAAAHLQPGAC